MSKLDVYFDEPARSPKDLILNGVKQMLNSGVAHCVYTVQAKPMATLFALTGVCLASMIIFNATVKQTERHPSPLFVVKTSSDIKKQTIAPELMNTPNVMAPVMNAPNFSAPTPKARQNANSGQMPQEQNLIQKVKPYTSPQQTPNANEQQKPKNSISARFASYQALKRPIDYTSPQGQALVKDIQTSLSERGFFKGKINGKWGENSVAALRAYEILNGLPDSGTPSPEMLIALYDSDSNLATASIPERTVIEKAEKPAIVPILPLKAKLPNHLKPDAHLQPEIAPDSLKAQQEPEKPAVPISQLEKQVPELANPWGASLTMAVEQRLFELGMNPGKVDGKYTAATQAAIEKFEREHNMPVTGRVSGRLLQEMSALSNTPIM